MRASPFLAFSLVLWLPNSVVGSAAVRLKADTAYRGGDVGRDLSLIEAVRSGDLNAVRALLKQGVDVNARYGDGTSALHWAVYRDNREAADALIRAGARVNAATDLGITPLWVACSNGNKIGRAHV